MKVDSWHSRVEGSIPSRYQRSRQPTAKEWRLWRILHKRHSYAVATVLGWYRDGGDVAAMMPRLSTYLGHNDPKHTYWYLSAAPELMALAGDRLHAHLQGES